MTIAQEQILRRAEGISSPAIVKAGRARDAIVADLFCGAGSLSAGTHDALIELGIRPKFIAVNHWDVATQTYALNHPGAEVHCVSLAAANPSILVPGGKLDLLMAGIDCTFHSRARGGKPITDQQRMSGWHVVQWCTELRVRRLLIENVPEYTRWGPVDTRSGRPIKSREGEYFWAWWRALEAIGFALEMRKLNCADYGDPTTRERLFILGRSDGKPIRWPTPSHGGARGGDMFGTVPWRTARDDVIDWGIRGKSIFNRKRPLAPKTLRRIAAGMVKFKWPEPFIVVLKQHCDARGIDLPLSTVHAGGQHFGLVQPFMVSTRQHTGGPAPRSVVAPTPTLTSTDSRLAVVEPFILNRHGEWRNGRAVSIDAPVPTADCRGAGYVVEPFVLSNQGGGAPRSVEQPVPGIVNKTGHALIAPYYGSGSGETCSSIDRPLPAATTKARFGLVMPVTHNDGSNRARSIDQPLPTLTTAARGELAFIAASFGERPTQAPRVHSTGEPAPTVCAQGRINLVEPGQQYDILFRMLEPHELAAAMSISTKDRPYKFVGNKTEVVRQIGQAVPRRTGRALAHALMAE